MAGETRRQRRDARRASGDQSGGGRGGVGPGGGGIPPSGVPQPEGAGGTPVPAGHVETHRRGGFLRESWAELNKVDWPNRAQVIQGTVVVIVAVAIVGAYLWGADQLLRPFVRDVLLGQ